MNRVRSLMALMVDADTNSSILIAVQDLLMAPSFTDDAVIQRQIQRSRFLHALNKHGCCPAAITETYATVMTRCSRFPVTRVVGATRISHSPDYGLHDAVPLRCRDKA